MDSKQDIGLLHAAWSANITQWCAETANMRNDTQRYVKEQLLRILLHSSNMTKVPKSVTVNRVATELSCSKRQVLEHGYSEECFEELIQPAKKKRKLKPNSFFIKHNDLVKVYL